MYNQIYYPLSLRNLFASLIRITRTNKVSVMFLANNVIKMWLQKAN